MKKENCGFRQDKNDFLIAIFFSFKHLKPIVLCEHLIMKSGRGNERFKKYEKVRNRKSKQYQ